MSTENCARCTENKPNLKDGAFLAAFLAVRLNKKLKPPVKKKKKQMLSEISPVILRSLLFWSKLRLAFVPICLNLEPQLSSRTKYIS